MVQVLLTGVSFGLKDQGNIYDNLASISQNMVVVKEPAYIPPQKLANPPEIVRAVYVTGYSAGAGKYLDYLTNLFKTTEINAVVVDIKDYSGLVSYKSKAPNAQKYNLYNNAIPDIDSLVRFFHDQNIYVIGRIAVFEDPSFAKARTDLAIYNKSQTTDKSRPILWQDSNGLSWVDPASKEVWDYNISLAKDALYHGFDEINFDYVRFPSDGSVKNMSFSVWDEKIPRQEVIKGFFVYLRSQLSGDKISADLFGQTTINKDDMGIGQIIENAFENFDYISPMIYPSHYINGFMGFANPAEHPYEVIKYSMDAALARGNNLLKQSDNLASLQTTQQRPVAVLRPWLQDFNMGANYDAEMVKKEIKATQDSLGQSYKGYMLWNPSNVYTKDAVLK
jgi:hypothetical protein